MFTNMLKGGSDLEGVGSDSSGRCSLSQLKGGSDLEGLWVAIFGVQC